MIWLRIISWAIGRGFVAGAVVGALLGLILAFLFCAGIGLLVGGLVGAILGLIDGIALAVITRFAYAPPNTEERYPQLAYAVPIFINVAPIFIFCGVGALINFSWNNAFTIMLIGAIPMTIMGVITAYFVGLFLEFVDWLMAQKVSHNLPIELLPHAEN